MQLHAPLQSGLNPCATFHFPARWHIPKYITRQYNISITTIWLYDVSGFVSIESMNIYSRPNFSRGKVVFFNFFKARLISRFNRSLNISRLSALFRPSNIRCHFLTSAGVTRACMKMNGGLYRRGARGGCRWDKHYTIATHILLWRDNNN